MINKNFFFSAHQVGLFYPYSKISFQLSKLTNKKYTTNDFSESNTPNTV